MNSDEVKRKLASHDALVKACAHAYVLLADIDHEWRGRNTLAGQALLCELRDAIVAATGRDQQEVQDAASISTRLFQTHEPRPMDDDGIAAC